MKPYVKPAMLECRRHPELGLWCREDGAVFIPAGGRGPKAHWTYGYKNNLGYMRVSFRGKHYLVHRLIARTFISNPNPEEYNEIDHKDRNPLNNAVSNLRWADRKMQQNNRQVCDDCLAKYGVRACEDFNKYQNARYSKDPEYAERKKARSRKQYAEDTERQRTLIREWKARQKALGRRNRTCPDGKRRYLTDEEFNDRFGQLRLF